jgi:hypothetical protein
VRISDNYMTDSKVTVLLLQIREHDIQHNITILLHLIPMVIKPQQRQAPGSRSRLYHRLLHAGGAISAQETP